MLQWAYLQSSVTYCNAGGLAALVAAMTYRGGLSWYAYHVLDRMLSYCQLPAKQISMIQDKLAGMHGVRVLSNLMSPFVRKQQSACHQKFFMLWGKPALHAAGSSMPCWPALLQLVLLFACATV